MIRKKYLIRIFACLLVVLSCTSCITSALISNHKKQVNNISSKNVTLTGKTVQRINRHAALAITDKNDVVCIVSDFEDYYDGMKIKNRYRRCGTYEYLFSDGTLHYAPIFIHSKDYKKYQINADELDAKRLKPKDKSQRNNRDI